MFLFLVILILIDAFLLGVVVLLQSGKGGGLSGIAAGGQATQILGARQAPDFLQKATWVLGTALIVLCFVAPFTIGGGASRSVLQEGGTLPPVEAPVTPGAPGPEAPGQAPDAPAPSPDAPPSSDQ